VAAALLKRAGFNVTGVYMRQWSPKVLGKECLWKQDRQDAMKVCAKLGIPFLTWDFSKDYEKEVGKYMIDSYRKGITPNPDVMCNKVIKFGLFFDWAMREGADFVATGHYAKTSLGNEIFSRLNPPAGGAHSPRKNLLPRSVKLLKAKDKNKDQTYFLWALKQKHLAKTLFPLGDLTKPEVRKLAKKFGLHVAEKKDSQGVCFIGPLDMKNFLKKYIKPKRGKIIDVSNSRELETSEHDGAYYYTIGQRHGLDIKNGKGPYFVVKKDIKKNIIYVGKEKDLIRKEFIAKNINWILNKKPRLPLEAKVMIRYRTKPASALIRADKDNGVKVIFDRPQKAIAPGQSAVFYKGQELIGGGIII
jgi:tRNA-specific 2-thiouridylase